ncbi:hypothetical protein J2Z53_001170 [Clostridium moniliforme]|uniref:Bypass of forespore C C-terminal domain-containing protein n=1 Tax=Clostridium moniliforme TaxID=39489 RepID=A0ABS4F013_9CLOT|nr:hypothetical protein [Clostridium moniliforme]MBP1889589.1 hypothetical protein [Clostridium moniliforme]
MRRKKYFILSIIAIICLFSITYYFVSKDIKSRNLNNSTSNKDINYTNNSGMELRDDLKVSFYTDKNRDKTVTISKLMNEYNIQRNLTEEVLSRAVYKNGYKLVDKSNDTFVYKRTKEESLNPNTYYIGESDGFLAIYKSDDKKNLSIEKVYSDDITIDMLRESDINKLKNFKYFNSSNLQEVEDKITELTT